MTDLSIIIVSYKGYDRLEACLSALDAFGGEDFTSEVIIVDNNSGDDIMHAFEGRFARFKFIYNSINGGFANGCNLGAGYASGEYLLFLNPDTVADGVEVAKLLDLARRNPSYTVLSCRQVNANGRESHVAGQFPEYYNLTGFMRAIIRRKHATPEGLKSNDAADITFPDWISGSVVMISENDFGAVGGFDEDFWMYFEDVDLCRRVRDRKGEVALASDIVIEHNHGGSSRINIATASLTKTEGLISRHVYIHKHKRGAERFFIQLFLVLNNIISGGLVAAVGLLFFYVPKIFSRTIIFCRLTGYYLTAAYRQTWISPRSVRYNIKK